MPRISPSILTQCSRAVGAGYWRTTTKPAASRLAGLINEFTPPRFVKPTLQNDAFLRAACIFCDLSAAPTTGCCGQVARI